MFTTVIDTVPGFLGGDVQPMNFGGGVNGQNTLEQPSATIETRIFPRQYLYEIGKRTPQDRYLPFEGPQMLRIDAGDLVFFPRKVAEANTIFNPNPVHDPFPSDWTTVESALSAFNGVRMYPSNDDYHNRFKFLGIARSTVVFDISTESQKLSVIAGGVVNWINMTTQTVDPGVIMTWMLDYEFQHPNPEDPLLKHRDTRSKIIKAYFCPARGNLVRPGHGNIGADYYHLVGRNGGTVVRPGKVGQLILGN